MDKCFVCNSPVKEIGERFEGERDIVHFGDLRGSHKHDRAYIFVEYVCFNHHRYEIMKHQRCFNEDCAYGTVMLGINVINTIGCQ
jgi:hypothetical protein